MKSSDEMYRSVLAKAEAKKEQIRKRNRTFRSAMVAFACALFAFVLGAGLERRIRLPYEPTAAVSITSSVNAAESPVTPSKGPGRDDPAETIYISAPAAVAAIPPTVMGTVARPTPTPAPETPSPAQG